MALESAAFLRAGEASKASVLEALLDEEVFQHLEPEIGVLYRSFRDCYTALSPDLDGEAVSAWMSAAFAPLLKELDKRGARLSAEFSCKGKSQ
jgi:hypothetical protein